MRARVAPRAFARLVMLARSLLSQSFAMVEPRLLTGLVVVYVVGATSLLLFVAALARKPA